MTALSATCPQCGTRLPSGEIFCGVCGTRVRGCVEGPRKNNSREPPENTESRNVLASIFRRYFDFRGRSSRREFWLTFVFWMVAAACSCIPGIVFYNIVDGNADDFWNGWGMAFGIYTVSTLIPGIATLIRRMHDVGFKGKRLFLFFTGFCSAYVLYLLCRKSQHGPNAWGEEPRLEASAPKPPKPAKSGGSRISSLKKASRSIVRAIRDATSAIGRLAVRFASTIRRFFRILVSRLRKGTKTN